MGVKMPISPPSIRASAVSTNIFWTCSRKMQHTHAGVSGENRQNAVTATLHGVLPSPYPPTALFTLKPSCALTAIMPLGAIRRVSMSATSMEFTIISTLKLRLLLPSLQYLRMGGWAGGGGGAGWGGFSSERELWG